MHRKDKASKSCFFSGAMGKAVEEEKVRSVCAAEKMSSAGSVELHGSRKLSSLASLDIPQLWLEAIALSWEQLPGERKCAACLRPASESLQLYRCSESGVIFCSVQLPAERVYGRG